jgi:hypothetical protein
MRHKNIEHFLATAQLLRPLLKDLVFVGGSVTGLENVRQELRGVVPQCTFKKVHFKPTVCIAKLASVPAIREFRADAAVRHGDVNPGFRD